MNIEPEDLYDAHCANCGAGYHFEVGFGGDACPNCGRSRTATLTDIEERNEREAEHAKRFDAGDIQRENMLAALGEYVSEFDLLAVTPDAKNLARLVRELATATMTANLKGPQ